MVTIPGTPLLRICLDLTPEAASAISAIMTKEGKLHWGFRIQSGQSYQTKEPLDAGMWEGPVDLQGRETREVVRVDWTDFGGI